MINATVITALSAIAKTPLPLFGDVAGSPPDLSAYQNTPIPPEKWSGYDDFVRALMASTGRDLRQEKWGYDVQGAFLSGQSPDASGHMTDRFKKWSHPTFSNESQYATPEMPGGKWSTNTFTPGQNALWPAGLLREYLLRNEPGVRLTGE